MRRTLALAGSYVLNQRVIPDWWHPYYREDAHAHAKDILAAAIRRDDAADAAAAASAQDGIASSSPSGASPMMSEDDGGDASHYRSHTLSGSPGIGTGAPTGNGANEEDYGDGPVLSNDGERSGEDGGAASLEADVSHSLSLYDVNALVATFTSNHDVDELSGALQYLRERLQQPLAPYHYHALFRVFNHSLDRENVVQLLEVMAQRGETTQETYARAVDCIHCLAPSDGLERILTIVRAAQEAFGSLVATDVARSEAATVAAYGSSRHIRQAALEEPDRMPGVRDEGGEAPQSSPVLSALLHHLAVSRGDSGCDPVAVLLVALWIRSLGVRLSDWDAVNVMGCLLTQVECFPRVRALLGSFSGFPVGQVSPGAVLQRLEERGELSDATSVLAHVASAMRRSLAETGVNMEAPVPIGILNTRATSLRTTLLHALDAFDGTREAVSSQTLGGLGSQGYNAALLYHTISLTQSALRDNTEATRIFLRAVEREEARLRRTQAEPESMDEANDDNAASSEPFAVGHQYLMDVGSLLPTLSMHTREDIREAFTRLVQRMALTERESQLEDTLMQGGDLASSSGAQSGTSAAVLGSAAAPPVRPTTADLVGVEAYTLGFTRTYEEAVAALQAAVARVDRTRARLPRETRLAFKQLAQYCCDHPLPNPKLTATGLAERRKWGAYLDARDTALALFGSAKQARDSMKHLYYNDNTLPALRSDGVIAQDFQDSLRVFFKPTTGASSSLSSSSSSSLSSWSPSALTMEDLTGRRTTQPHVRCAAHAVPPHLYDPNLFNVYPHVMLRRQPVGVAQLEREAAELPGDIFAELWRSLMNPAVMGNDPWYLRNTDMWLLLMRCLLHRLDWEAAAHLTAKMLEQTSYTYLMDHELTTIFREIGDPAGCLAFKVATKLFDGRITRDGQTKRERFHQEQFQ